MILQCDIIINKQTQPIYFKCKKFSKFKKKLFKLSTNIEGIFDIINLITFNQCLYDPLKVSNLTILNDKKGIRITFEYNTDNVSIYINELFNIDEFI